MDLRQLYADAQARAASLLSPLEPSQAGSPVPGTPEWTVADLTSHLSGVAADIPSGNVAEGPGSPAWTARQVAERKGRPLDEVLAEWESGTPRLLDLLATPGPTDLAAFDMLTHEHDLRGALGVAGPSDVATVTVVLDRLVAPVSGKVDEAGLPGLRLVGSEHDWTFGAAAVGLTGTGETMEWFRTLMGRRSAAQVATYAWDSDPGPYLGLLSLFGELPSAVVAEAGAPAA